MNNYELEIIYTKKNFNYFYIESVVRTHDLIECKVKGNYSTELCDKEIELCILSEADDFFKKQYRFRGDYYVSEVEK